MTQNTPDELTSVQEQTGIATPPRGRVLVVDDVMLLCEAIVRLLHQAHFEGVIAHDAEEALQLVKTQPFDLVVTDVMMPGRSGVDLVEELGRIRPALKCIVMTGHATKVLITRLKAARNVIGVQTKPLNTQRLIAQISASLGAGQTQHIQ
ncbi:MAG TPA: response regulator [Phycisphaerae bacterium]|nr:response regulator [Phycisphaerae bacterium]